jgi:hypothetical protein
MTLFGERRRREKRDQAESEGSDFWTETLDDRARYKLAYAVKDAIDDDRGVYDKVRDWTLKSLGLPTLAGISRAEEDVLQAILNADEDIVFSLLEACNVACLVEKQNARYAYEVDQWKARQESFYNTVREVLREHRVKFDLVNVKVIPLESQELHVEIVQPVLRLLASRPGWDLVEKAYQKGLVELHDGHPDDAITDAAVALEEALAIHGCTGNNLSKKMASAKAKGVLAPQDSPLADALSKIGAWIEAERSTSGDAHNARPAAPQDGWLVVHIVGALIKRLAEGPRAG